jgi:hypothetical protein
MMAVFFVSCSQKVTDISEGDFGEIIEPSSEYRDMINSLIDDASSITSGNDLFQTNCASCHGINGDGNGPASGALEPKPSSFADPSRNEMLSDGYLFWRISEGGLSAPFNSAMPAWKPIFSEVEIWQLVSFIRTLSE